jgi:hypothetical protein
MIAKGSMAKDPLYHDERQFERMAGDPQIMQRILRLQWVKFATGLVALALIIAIWLNWRVG